MNNEAYISVMKDYAKGLFSIDSPSGFTDRVCDYLIEQAKELGFEYRRNRMGNVVITVEGEDTTAPVGLSAHIDTLGLMVRSITADGQLMFTTVGGPILPTLDGEYCRIYTMDGNVYTGTILSLSPAVHVFPDASTRPRDCENMAVRLDEVVHSKEDVEKLGIGAGDYICYEPKTTFTESGFLKSRFIDDKGSAAILLSVLQYLAKTVKKPAHTTYFCFSSHEEVGYGGSTLPTDMHEFIAVDMGCIGLDLSCTEEQVSICPKDSGMIYDYELTGRLVKLAKENHLNYARDIYPHYSSDALAGVRSGLDIKCGLIGPGVAASHGMERTHFHGMLETFNLVLAYLSV